MTIARATKYYLNKNKKQESNVSAQNSVHKQNTELSTQLVLMQTSH